MNDSLLLIGFFAAVTVTCFLIAPKKEKQEILNKIFKRG